MSQDGPAPNQPQVGGGRHSVMEEKEKRKSRRSSLFGKSPVEKERRKEKGKSAPELMEGKPRAAYIPQHAAKDAMHLGLQPEDSPLATPVDFVTEPHSLPWAPMPISPLAIDQRVRDPRAVSPAPFGPHYRSRSLSSTAGLGPARSVATPYGQGESSRYRSTQGSLASLSARSSEPSPERPTFPAVRPLSPRTLTSPNWTKQSATPSPSTGTTSSSDRPIFIGVTPRPFPNNHASLPPSLFPSANGISSPSDPHLLLPPRPPFSSGMPPRSLSSSALSSLFTGAPGAVPQEPRSRRTSLNGGISYHHASPLSLPPITASPSPPPSSNPPTEAAMEEPKPAPTSPKADSPRPPITHAVTDPLPSISPKSDSRDTVKSTTIEIHKIATPPPQLRKPNKLKKKRPMKFESESAKHHDSTEPGDQDTALEPVKSQEFVDAAAFPITEEDPISSPSDTGTPFYTPLGSVQDFKEIIPDEPPQRSPKRLISPERERSPTSPMAPQTPLSSAQDYAEEYRLAIEEYSPHAGSFPLEVRGKDTDNEELPFDKPPERSKRRPASLTYESLQNLQSIKPMEIPDFSPIPPLEFRHGSDSSSLSLDLNHFPDLTPLSNRPTTPSIRASPERNKSLDKCAKSNNPCQPTVDPVIIPETTASELIRNPISSSDGSVTRLSDWPLQSTNISSQSSHTSEYTEPLEFLAIPYPPPSEGASQYTLPRKFARQKEASVSTIACTDDELASQQVPTLRRKPNKLHKERRLSVSTQHSTTSSIWSNASSNFSKIIGYIKPRRGNRDSFDIQDPDSIDIGGDNTNTLDNTGTEGEDNPRGRRSRRSSFSSRNFFPFSRKSSVDKPDKEEKAEKKKRKGKREMPVAPALERYNRSVGKLENMKM